MLSLKAFHLLVDIVVIFYFGHNCSGFLYVITWEGSICFTENGENYTFSGTSHTSCCPAKDLFSYCLPSPYLIYKTHLLLPLSELFTPTLGNSLNLWWFWDSVLFPPSSIQINFILLWKSTPQYDQCNYQRLKFNQIQYFINRNFESMFTISPIPFTCLCSVITVPNI